jgi:hypothetical protein
MSARLGFELGTRPTRQRRKMPLNLPTTSISLFYYYFTSDKVGDESVRSSRFWRETAARLPVSARPSVKPSPKLFPLMICRKKQKFSFEARSDRGLGFLVSVHPREINLGRCFSFAEGGFVSVTFVSVPEKRIRGDHFSVTMYCSSSWKRRRGNIFVGYYCFSS